ncbi:MAG: YdcF family protein [Anaerolineae bacterium]
MTDVHRSQTADDEPQRLPRQRWIIFFVAVGAVVAVLLGRSLWLPFVGDFLVVADPLQPADAIVVLGGGGRERVESGAKLFESDYAPWFIVTNNRLNIPGIRAEYAELMKTEAMWQGVPEDQILTAPGIAETTYEEALAIRQLSEERGLRSLIVVTDPFHTRRARMAFRDAFRNTGIAVMVRPANESEYHPDSWWQTRDGLRDTWTEYLKLALYLAGYR